MMKYNRDDDDDDDDDHDNETQYPVVPEKSDTL
jgi:hypothetical protein